MFPEHHIIIISISISRIMWQWRLE